MQHFKNILTKRLLGAAILSAALITPAIASAQDYSYDDGGGQAAEQIQGTIAGINGTWNITVNDANGYADSVELHQGTIINPTGLTLEPGMNVTIDGYADGPNFDAIEIDTPYQYDGPAPVAVYYGDGSWYPGYAAGWGPSFNLFFNLNTRRYEQRSFAFNGQIRRPLAPPSGWQNRPHGFIAHAYTGPVHHVAYRPQQQRSFSAPAQQRRDFSAPTQQRREFSAPAQQPQRTFAAPPQQRRAFSAPAQQPQRTFAAPPQQRRAFSAPAQQPQRTFAAPPQQQRQFSAPRQQMERPAAAAPQQQRQFSAPRQQMERPAAAAPAPRAAPQARGAAEVTRENRASIGERRH